MSLLPEGIEHHLWEPIRLSFLLFFTIVFVLLLAADVFASSWSLGEHFLIASPIVCVYGVLFSLIAFTS